MKRFNKKLIKVLLNTLIFYNKSLSCKLQKNINKNNVYLNYRKNSKDNINDAKNLYYFI